MAPYCVSDCSTNGLAAWHQSFAGWRAQQTSSRDLVDTTHSGRGFASSTKNHRYERSKDATNVAPGIATNIARS